MGVVNASPVSEPAESEPAPAAKPERIAAFFDLDHTLVACSSAFAFGKPFVDSGEITRREALVLTFRQLTFRFFGRSEDGLDGDGRALSAIVTGKDAGAIQKVVEQNIANVIMPTVYPEAKELIRRHRDAGHVLVVVSASPEDMVRPIASRLGIEHAVGTRMSTIDGRYSGQITFFCKSQYKLVAMREIAEEFGIDLQASYAYSDSGTDLAMLEGTGHPHAVNPDRDLRRLAEERGWPILEFTNPLPPVRVSQLPKLRRRTVTAMVTAGTACVATFAVLALQGTDQRRHRGRGLLFS